MKTFKELKDRVIKEYDSRNLKSSVRYKSLDDFEDFLKRKYPELIDDVSKFLSMFPTKEKVKLCYEKDRNERNLKLSQAASSMINEIYNQLNLV